MTREPTDSERKEMGRISNAEVDGEGKKSVDEEKERKNQDKCKKKKKK